VRRRPRGAAALLCRAARGEAGHHRLGADQLPLRRVRGRRPPEARIRPLLRQELHPLPRPPNPPPDGAGGAVPGGRAMIVLLGFWTHALAALLYGALALWQ